MKKRYILYKMLKVDNSGKPILLYIEKIAGSHIAYTGKISKAKRFSIISALWLSMPFRFSFVPEKLANIYK